MERLTLTAVEIARALGIGRAAAYDLMHRADFPSIRVGRRMIVSRDAFLRWLEMQTADKLDAISGR